MPDLDYSFEIFIGKFDNLDMDLPDVEVLFVYRNVKQLQDQSWQSQ